MGPMAGHSRSAIVDEDLDAVGSGSWLQDIRTWEAYHAWQTRYRKSLSVAASLPLWQRIRRRPLRCALEHWKRVDRILAAQDEFKRLVHHQRGYLLRKLLLKRYWRSVSLAFDQWARVCRYYMRLELQVHKWRKKSAMDLAVAKWKTIVRTERLEEETAACRCVLSLRKAARLAQRVTRRADRERLVSCWVQWKAWYRQQRCLAWGRGVSLAMGRYFVAWKRLHCARRQERLQTESFSRGIVLSIMDESVAQCQWRQRVRNQQTQQLTALASLLSHWIGRVLMERLSKSLSAWKQHAAERGDSSEPGPASPVPSVIATKPRFPQRFTTAYRAQRQRQRSTATQEYPRPRPHWR